MKNRFFIFIFLPTVTFFIIAFWIKGILMLDPDFGWHIRMGEIIEKTGIPKTDPFSYTMSSYPFVDHEWLTNIILAKLYPIIGTVGLAIIFVFLTMSSLLIRLAPVSKWFFVPYILAAAALFPLVGIRPQLITWFFFSILLFILFNQKAWKWRFILPFLFLAWSNLHGGFGIGIATLFVVTLLHIWEQKKILFGEIIILILCFAAILINPYGIRLWWELWMQVSDTSLRWRIAEWRPAIFIPSFALWLFVGFSVISVTRYRKKFHLSEVVLYYGLLLAGISSIRHMPLFILAAFPMTIMAIEWFFKEANTYKGGKERFKKAYITFAIGVAFAVIVEVLFIIEGTKSSYSSYPKQAVEFLAKSRSCGQLFSTYGWGGYLIWKLPEKKVFIDGRMPSWRRESSPHLESNYAFEEYNKILSGEIPIQLAIDKYKIDTVLLPAGKQANKNPVLEKLEEIEAKIFGSRIDEGRFVNQLIDEGMVEIYKDNTAVIYRDKKHSAQCAKPLQ